MFPLLVAVATTAVTCVLIYSYRRRRPPTAESEAEPKACEEEQRPEAEQGAVRRAEIDEYQGLEVERGKLEEEPGKEEEKRSKTQEDPKRFQEEAGLAKEEAEPKEREEPRPKAEVEKERLEPGKRGGRPRDQARDRRKPKAGETKEYQPKPGVVCWKTERKWIPAVEVPEHLLGNSGLVVLQNGMPLTQDEDREGCWGLEQAFGEAVVRLNEDEGGRETSVPLGEDNHLLFKLSGQNQNWGRRVKSPSYGWYLVIVPDNWKRDDAFSGPPPVKPEPVSIDGYQGHYFVLEKDGDGKIYLRTPDDEPVVIGSKASPFELVGARLNDASEDMGPLFGKRPPQIRAPDDQAWEDVGTIVVGEEGSGKGKWRMAFSPVLGQTQQDLPSGLAARKGGWYFLRIYDTNDDLVESVDFRFLTALNDVNLYPHALFPGPGGHSHVRLEFIHESRCTVRLARGPASSLQIEHEDERTSAIIPPDPAWDLTYWEVKSASRSKVSVEILIERVWWSLGEEGAPLTQKSWLDKPVCVPHDSFRPTSNECICLWLPKPRWTHRVLVGFEQSKSKAFRVEVNERMVSIALREFGDTDEIRNRTQQVSLKVWLDRNGTLEGGIAICEILPEREMTEPSMPDEEADPAQMRCCSTCDHARRQHGIVWCRRYHWDRVSDDVFGERFARFVCGEWQGEYYDPEGNYHGS